MNGTPPHAFAGPPPVALLYARGPQGEPAPFGWAFNVAGELVPLPFAPPDQAPQMPWESLDNPAYVAYAQGLASIEQQPSTDPRVPQRYGQTDSSGRSLSSVDPNLLALVPQDAYLESRGDVVPSQDEGTGSQAVFDAPASPVRVRWRLARPILGVIQVDPPGVGSPLLVQPAGVAETLAGPPIVPQSPPFGGAVALAHFSWGHKGTQSQLVCDVLPGTLVKFPTVGSFLRITGRIAPQYFAASDQGAAPNIFRQYLLFPGGPILTNDSFSDLPPNIMDLQGIGAGTIVAAGVQANPVQFSGWGAEGLSPTPSIDALPTRVFRGSVPSAAPGTAWTSRSRVPIPHGAQWVRVTGGFFNSADNPQAVAVQWVQVLNWTGGAVEGPFAANADQPMPLLKGATAIDVMAASSGAGNTIEVPFDVHFYLSGP